MTAENVYRPFNDDVERLGGYQYTKTARKSAIYANRRDSDLIIRMGRLDGRRVVDVGCGDGTYTATLRDETRAASILGIDPAARAIESAIGRFTPGRPDLEFRCCLAKDLIVKGERFDLAVYRGVIHHCGDPAKEVADALRLADVVLFLEPNGWNPVLKAIERLSRYHMEHKERSFRGSTIRRWIRAGEGEAEVTLYSGLVPFFCPDWFVAVGSTLEPIIQRIPLLRMFACGQVCILAKAVGEQSFAARVG